MVGEKAPSDTERGFDRRSSPGVAATAQDRAPSASHSSAVLVCRDRRAYWPPRGQGESLEGNETRDSERSSQ